MTPEEQLAQLRWLDAQEDAQVVADVILRAYPPLRLTNRFADELAPELDRYLQLVRQEFGPLAAKYTPDVAASALILALSAFACYFVDVAAAKEGKTRDGLLDELKRIEEWKKDQY